MKKAIFWALSWTWGIITTLMGTLIALALIIAGHKPKRFHGLVYFEVGEGWGGVNFGPFFFISHDCGLHAKQHEAGHGLQNVMLGPLMPFLVLIPSAARYWWRRYLVHIGKGDELTPYDSAWFEGWATALGVKYFEELET